jgi:hypothetical protein
VACNKGTLCNGGCDNAHWAPSTLPTLTVTQIYVMAASCGDTSSTPNAYATITFRDPSPNVTDTTGYCSEAPCAPGSPHQFQHIQASWLTDGSTLYLGWDHNTFEAHGACWGGPFPFAAPLAVEGTYQIPVGGYG